MRNLKELIFQERLQYQVYVGLSIVVTAMTGFLYYFYHDNHGLFQKLIGNINPLMAVLLVVALGSICLTFLLYKRLLSIYKNRTLNNIIYLLSFSLLFMPISILVDVTIGFPIDLNLLFPESVSFYPAIAFFVEIIFHVLPLSVGLFVLTSVFQNSNHERLIWICIGLVSLLEPVYQTTFMFGSDHYPLWSAIAVWLNIFLFNVSQLYIFKRYDFIAMYVLRIGYYFSWHIVWGYFRLDWLF